MSVVGDRATVQYYDSLVISCSQSFSRRHQTDDVQVFL